MHDIELVSESGYDERNSKRRDAELGIGMLPCSTKSSFGLRGFGRLVLSELALPETIEGAPVAGVEFEITMEDLLRLGGSVGAKQRAPEGFPDGIVPIGGFVVEKGVVERDGLAPGFEGLENSSLSFENARV